MTLCAIQNVTLRVPDIDRAHEFFGPLMAFLGYRQSIETRDMRIWESAGSECRVGLWQALSGGDGVPAAYASGINHLAFAAETRKQVDDCHRLVARLPGRVLTPPTAFDPPHCYALFFESPDGTLLELVYHPPSRPSETCH